MVTRAEVASKIEGQGGKHLGAGAATYPTKEKTMDMHNVFMEIFNAPSDQWKKDQQKLNDEKLTRELIKQVTQASKN